MRVDEPPQEVITRFSATKSHCGGSRVGLVGECVKGYAGSRRLRAS